MGERREASGGKGGCGNVSACGWRPVAWEPGRDCSRKDYLLIQRRIPMPGAEGTWQSYSACQYTRCKRSGFITVLCAMSAYVVVSDRSILKSARCGGQDSLSTQFALHASRARKGGRGGKASRPHVDFPSKYTDSTSPTA